MPDARALRRATPPPSLPACPLPSSSGCPGRRHAAPRPSPTLPCLSLVCSPSRAPPSGARRRRSSPPCAAQPQQAGPASRRPSPPGPPPLSSSSPTGGRRVPDARAPPRRATSSLPACLSSPRRSGWTGRRHATPRTSLPLSHSSPSPGSLSPDRPNAPVATARRSRSHRAPREHLSRPRRRDAAPTP